MSRQELYRDINPGNWYHEAKNKRGLVALTQLKTKYISRYIRISRFPKLCPPVCLWCLFICPSVLIDMDSLSVYLCCCLGWASDWLKGGHPHWFCETDSALLFAEKLWECSLSWPSCPLHVITFIRGLCCFSQFFTFLTFSALSTQHTSQYKDGLLRLRLKIDNFLRI